MAARISHSILDPYLTVPLKSIYKQSPIPSKFPPEGIVFTGHLLAIVGAFGFAYSTTFWWAGLVAAFCVAGNHIADVLDGTHARATGQCRNGGELLDHFVDPLSFSYWLVGLSVAAGRLELGLAAVICIYATAVLTNIKAKLIGEFSLASLGPTGFTTLLVAYALALSLFDRLGVIRMQPTTVPFSFLSLLVLVGVIQLIVHLVQAVRDVNAHGTPPDQTEWETTRADQQSTRVRKLQSEIKSLEPPMNADQRR